MHPSAAVLLLLTAASIVHAEPPTLTGKVIKIADGDTLTILDGAKKQTRIRFWGIDAPESKQDFGQKAKQALSGLTFGNDVRVEVTDTDRYGRTVGIVFVGDVNLNRKLVEDGWAWHWPKYLPDDEELARLHPEAKAAKRGPMQATSTTACDSAAKFSRGD
jgi:endonuclease YncB( thermonuclease family)